MIDVKLFFYRTQPDSEVSVPTRISLFFNLFGKNVSRYNSSLYKEAGEVFCDNWIVEIHENMETLFQSFRAIRDSSFRQLMIFNEIKRWIEQKMCFDGARESMMFH